MSDQHDRKRPPIIAIAGTKGKTSIVRLLDFIYRQLGYTTLAVDTDGHYVNGEQQSGKDDNLELYGLIPSVSPGRFMYELKDKTKPIAILEASISSYRYGLGYSRHSVAVFTNVFEDHIGHVVKNRQELAEKKAEFIYGQIEPTGVVVFNADDKLVVKHLDKLPEKYDNPLIPVGLNFDHFNLNKHLKTGGSAFTVEHGWAVLKTKDQTHQIIKLTDVTWTFEGIFTPSIYNLLLTIAAVYAELGSDAPLEKIADIIKQYKLAPTGGRLTPIYNPDTNIKFILDYAHEKYSLLEVAKLANDLSTNKTIGILRFAPERHSKLLKDYSKFLANAFDTVIIYDKIDGEQATSYSNKKIGIERTVGEVSQIVYDAISKHLKKGHQAFRHIKEEDAIIKAMQLADSGDVIVHIVNDDHARSVDLVNKHLFDQ